MFQFLWGGALLQTTGIVCTLYPLLFCFFLCLCFLPSLSSVSLILFTIVFFILKVSHSDYCVLSNWTALTQSITKFASHMSFGRFKIFPFVILRGLCLLDMPKCAWHSRPAAHQGEPLFIMHFHTITAYCDIEI